MFIDQHKPTVIPLIQVLPWVCLDLETGDAPETAIQAAVEAWKAPSNWKPETVTAKRQEAAEKIREKAALLDASPILCVAMATDTTRIVINGMGHEAPKIEGWHVLPAGDEEHLLLTLRNYLELIAGPQTAIVGHNIRGFDLPKLRQAYLRHRLRAPAVLAAKVLDFEPQQQVIDTASLFRAFSMEHRDDFCPSLDAVAISLDITRPKGVISGADVPRLHREGRFTEIITYCAIDAAVTARAYQLMSGSANDLQ